MAAGVTIWHIPFFVMPQFGFSPMGPGHDRYHIWYAWLFSHASGSSLLTLIGHATEGTIGTSWRSDRDDQLPNGRQLGTEWLSEI